MIELAARLYTGDASPRGCLLAGAAATGSKAAADVREAATQERCAIREILIERSEEDIEVGLLPPETVSCVLADLALALALTQGMSVLARGGPGRDALLAVARASMSGSPRSRV